MLSLFIYELTDFYPNDIFMGLLTFSTPRLPAVVLTAHTPAEISEALVRICTDIEEPTRPLPCMLIQVCAVRDLFCLFVRSVDGWSWPQMPGGQPALLKTRRKMKYEDALSIWLYSQAVDRPLLRLLDSSA